MRWYRIRLKYISHEEIVFVETSQEFYLVAMNSAMHGYKVTFRRVTEDQMFEELRANKVVDNLLTELNIAVKK